MALFATQSAGVTLGSMSSLYTSAAVYTSGEVIASLHYSTVFTAGEVRAATTVAAGATVQRDEVLERSKRRSEEL